MFFIFTFLLTHSVLRSAKIQAPAHRRHRKRICATFQSLRQTYDKTDDRPLNGNASRSVIASKKAGLFRVFYHFS